MQTLTLRGVRKQFAGDPTAALHDINLAVTSGEFLCLIGPSGCGKSTLLRLISGLDQPTSGTITGVTSSELAMVFQNFALFPWLTVFDNVAFGLRMQRMSDEQIRKRVDPEIERMGLTSVAHQHPKELSGGMKQRVGIARALVVKPKVLLLDEPFSALDAFTAQTLRQELLGIWEQEQLTVVMVTHLVDEAVELADRIGVFSSRPGTIVKILTNHLKRPRVKRAAPDYQLADKLTELIIRPSSRPMQASEPVH